MQRVAGGLGANGGPSMTRRSARFVTQRDPLRGGIFTKSLRSPDDCLTTCGNEHRAAQTVEGRRPGGLRERRRPLHRTQKHLRPQALLPTRQQYPPLSFTEPRWDPLRCLRAAGPQFTPSCYIACSKALKTAAYAWWNAPYHTYGLARAAVVTTGPPILVLPPGSLGRPKRIGGPLRRRLRRRLEAVRAPPARPWYDRPAARIGQARDDIKRGRRAGGEAPRTTSPSS